MSARRAAGRAYVAGIAAVLTLAACSAGPPSEDPTLAADREFFTGILAEARAADADDEQIAILEVAAETGALSPADLAGLFEPFDDCVATVGAYVYFDGVREIAPGVTLPKYIIHFPEGTLTDENFEEVDQIVLDCEFQYIGYIWKALQLRPSVIELQDAEMLAHRDEIAACVGEQGYPVDADATVGELVNAIMNVRVDTGVVCYDAQNDTR
jgi:hypothetical protein